MSELERGNLFIVKAGTSTLLNADRSPDRNVFEHMAQDISGFWCTGKRFIIVTSGAVELGRAEVGERATANTDPGTFASAGQDKLMREYGNHFGRQDIGVSQVLVESNHFEISKDNPETSRVMRVISQNLQLGRIPIVNENDSVSEPKTTLGDNDALTAKLAIWLESRGRKVDGVFILSVSNGSAEQKALGRGSASAKSEAIREMEGHGIKTMLVEGKKPHVIMELFRSGEAFEEARRSSQRLIVGRTPSLATIGDAFSGVLRNGNADEQTSRRTRIR